MRVISLIFLISGVVLWILFFINIGADEPDSAKIYVIIGNVSVFLSLFFRNYGYKILKRNQQPAYGYTGNYQKTTVEQIRELAELKNAGILTEEEFSEKKKELLKRI